MSQMESFVHQQELLEEEQFIPMTLFMVFLFLRKECDTVCFFNHTHLLLFQNLVDDDCCLAMVKMIRK
jgi:hypothetical protein